MPIHAYVRTSLHDDDETVTIYGKLRWLDGAGTDPVTGTAAKIASSSNTYRFRLYDTPDVTGTNMPVDVDVGTVWGIGGVTPNFGGSDNEYQFSGTFTRLIGDDGNPVNTIHMVFQDGDAQQVSILQEPIIGFNLAEYDVNEPDDWQLWVDGDHEPEGEGGVNADPYVTPMIM